MKETRGNPNLVKGGPSLNPAGRPKGSLNVKNKLKVSERLHEKHQRHPVDELVKLADSLKYAGKFEESADIWRDLLKYMEPQKKPVESLPEKPLTPQDSKEAAEATMRLIQELENGSNTPATSSDQSSLDAGASSVPSEAGTEEDLRCSEGQQGTDLHS